MPQPRPTRVRRRRALIWFSRARRTPRCLRGEVSSVLIRPFHVPAVPRAGRSTCRPFHVPFHVPVDSGGVPA
jgi:hypothetical protein